MIILDSIKVLLLLLLCSHASYSDCKFNIIENKWIVIFLLSGLTISIPEYIIFHTDIVYRVINIAVINVISILLYLMRIWSGGDSKLVAVISILVPYNFFLPFIRNYFCLSFILVFAFGISFLALIVDSIIVRAKTKESVNKKRVIHSFARFIYRYFVTLVYITLVNEIIVHCVMDQTMATLFLVVANLGMILLLNIKVFSPLLKLYVVMPVLTAGIAMKIVFHTPLITVRTILTYAAVLLVSALRILINEYNYEIIPTKDVKPGMVISLQTTLLFVSSNVKGLPAISKENMGSRITEEEAKSIISWSESKDGTDTIIIVRKMPFAVFISLGATIFMILGALV